MKLLHDNRQIPFEYAAFIEDITQYYSTVEVVVPGLYTGKFTIEDKTSQEFHILRWTFENDKYRYTLVSERTLHWLNSTSASFTGFANVQQLLSKLGIRNTIKVATNSSYWILPDLKPTSLCSYLNKFAVISNGGAPFFYCDFNGELNVVDLKLQFRNNPTRTLFDVSEDRSTIDWILNYPGTVNINSYSSEGDKKSVLKNDDWGFGNLYINDTTHYATDAYKQYLTSDYYRNFYTSRTVSGIARGNVPEVGDTVSIDESNQKYVVTARTVYMDSINDSVPSINLKLNSPCPGL